MKVPLVLMLVSGLLLWGENKMLFGELINAAFPCKQDPRNSFPCFGVYDIYFSLFCAGVFIVSSFIIIFRYLRLRKTGNAV